MENTQIYRWKKNTRSTMPEYDGKYLVFIEQPQECGNVLKYQQVVECLFNQWQVKENETVTHWTELIQNPLEKYELECSELLGSNMVVKNTRIELPQSP